MEMSDPLSRANGVSRLPSTRARPRLPQGPRIPHKSQSQGQPLNNVPPTSVSSSPSTSTSQLASPTPLLPSITQAISPESLPPIYTESQDILVHSPLPALLHQSRTSSDVGVQATPTPSPSPNSEAKLTVKVIPKPVTLVPPPQINFDSVPISFKSLPLEAAQWTLTSVELQEIVSRAIRLSARESFIRVLPIESLDKGIVNENERLAALKLTTQSQYRFQVHRRTMLLQALNSSASAAQHDPSIITSLAVQLSETTTQCDRLMEELLWISDQQIQLGKVQDLHSASALAIALRKINKSYERRIDDLRKAQDKIEVLEAELEEAWKEAEKVAQEIDDIEVGISGDESEDITAHTARMVGVTGKAVATAAKLMSSTEANAPLPNNSAEDGAKREPEMQPDVNHSRRHNSDRSSRWSRVAAAKMRSRRTSDASLRVTRRSLSRAGRGSEDKRRPPVPNLPADLQGNSFLDLDNMSPSPLTSMAQYDYGVTRASELGKFGFVMYLVT
jgi:hypothetical protein